MSGGDLGHQTQPGAVGGAAVRFQGRGMGGRRGRDLSGAARRLLKEHSIPWQEEAGYLILPILPDEKAARLTRRMGEQGLGVLRLEERQKTLEEIFLELTGKAASL